MITDTSLLTNTTCLHVSDLDRSIKWYTEFFGVSVIKTVTTDKYKSAFIALDSESHPYSGKPVSQRTGVIELRCLIGVSPDVKIYSGNSAPYRGYGHICFAVSNLEEAQKQFLAKGIEFTKKFDEGSLKNIAFILDPDQYWIELIENEINKKPNVYEITSNRMNHTMFRIKDPEISLKFYRDVLGMKLYSKRVFPSVNFTLYVLGYEHDPDYVEGLETPLQLSQRESILELTHEWGTENDDSFEGYYVFGEDPMAIGFEHVSISSKNSAAFIEYLESAGVKFLSKDQDKGIATITDPDGWKVEIHSYDYLN